jgi:PAS domain S-box-containing protein
LRRTFTAYAVAIAALGAAVLVRWLLDPLLGDSLPLVTLFGAVAAAVWAGGWLPAVLVTLFGWLACAYLFIGSPGGIPLDGPNAAGLVAYLFTCALIVVVGEAARRAQARANNRGDLLRVTLASIGDAVITTDDEGRVDYLNRVAESLTGWSRTEAKGQPLETVFRIVDERTRAPGENPATRALREGRVVGLANRSVLIARGGGERPIDDSAAPIQDESGRVSGCVLVFRDISERRRWEKDEANRLLSARLLASIVESSDDAIVRKTLDGMIESWNAGAERLFGYSADQAVGRHVSLIIPPDRLAEEDHIVGRLRAGERIDHFETERLHSSGRRLLVSLTVSPIRDAEGNVVAASKIVRDISEQRRAQERERALQAETAAANSRLRAFHQLVEASTDFVGICDLEGVPFYVNPAGLALVGLEGMDEARGKHIRDFFFPEDQPRITDELLPAVVEKGHGELEVRFRNFRTGEARWMAYKVLALTGATGKTEAFGTVSQDVTDRRRLEDNLRSLAADLSEADRQKNEFLATLAHELRNPLAPLSNTLELLKRAGGDPAALPRALETMDRQLGQMVRLVDDLLDLSRITHNRLELRKRRVELGAVIDQAVEAARPLAESAGHEVRLVPAGEPLYLEADAVRLAQVFGNLLNNSYKYTNPGGRVTVTTWRDGGEAVVAIEDTGAGIPPDKLDSIFEMFTQVDRSLERSRGGLGIGLTLVRRLVQMHGGSVEARSAGEGLGSQLIVRLPVVAFGEAPAPEPVVAGEPAQRRRILVVDDNEDAATSLAMLLQLAGHETYTAHDGASALESAERHRPEVVLLDIGLPILNGYEVCRRVREQPWGQEMVLVALTGWGQEEDRIRSRGAGFDDHLVKPVDYAALTALIASLETRAGRSTHLDPSPDLRSS